MNTDTKYLHSFALIPSIGARALQKISEYFPSFEDAWRAREEDIRNAGLDLKTISAILWKRPSIDPDREIEALSRESIWIIRVTDTEYPTLLKEIPNPPFVLYGSGSPSACASPIAIGVVGTRKPTSYGIQAAETITRTLGTAGITIVSGLALGIDAIAHQAALEANASTIAVLGSGIDEHSIYPSSNRGLARRIKDSGGIVISEYPPKTPAMKEHFPQRNRIISGISKGVLVIEAQEKSGALITARFALEHNRDVFAVPGSIFSLSSAGTNALIQEGAKLVSTGEDILKEYGIDYTTENAPREAVDETAGLILRTLTEPRTVDHIKFVTGLDTPAIIASLSLLELKGRVRPSGGDTFERII